MKKIKSLAFGFVLELNKIIKIIFLFICINSKESYFKNFNQLPRGKPTRHSKEKYFNPFRCRTLRYTQNRLWEIKPSMRDLK